MNKKEIQNTNLGMSLVEIENKIAANEKFNELQKQVVEAKKVLAKLKIDSKEEMEDANLIAAKVKAFGRALEEFRKETKKPFLDGGKKVDEILNPVLADIKEIGSDVSQKIIKFSEEEDKRIEAQQEKEEKKVDTGYQGEALAEKKIENLENDKIGSKVGGETGAKGSIVETIDFNVTKLDKIPDEFIIKTPNGQAIRDFFRKDRNGKIPGVEIVIKKGLRN